MKILSLGLSGAPDELRYKLHQDCRTLVAEGFRIAIDETNKGHYTFFGCNIAEGEMSFRNYERVKNLLKGFIAQILADLIVNKEEKALLRKIINHNYHYLGEQDRALILTNALHLLEAGSGCSDEGFGPATRRNQVLGVLQDYLDTHHELVLDGFIAFRLKDYREKLAEVVDKAVDAYMLDFEYKEFIRVLRYFVDVQETQVDEVHIIVGDENNFRLQDAQGQLIPNHYLDNYLFHNQEEINLEDLLISALITIAPRQVVMHLAAHQTPGVVCTIENVFEGRVTLCPGCALCRDESVGQVVPDTERN